MSSSSRRLQRLHDPADSHPDKVQADSRAIGDERDLFRKDRDKILYTQHLRRLAGVTQVLSPIGHGGDRLHNRLTHTVEVAQIARRLAERLNYGQRAISGDLGYISPDVAEAAAWAHDLGHPPFGHAGEKVLDDLLTHFPLQDGRRLDCGGFEGNAQSFRILAVLTPSIADENAFRSVRQGMNLTRATYAGLLKYPWVRCQETSKFGVYGSGRDLEVFNWVKDGMAGEVRSPEAEIMDFADDVAYSIFDVFDFVRTKEIDLSLYSEQDDFQKFIDKQIARQSGPIYNHREVFNDAGKKRLIHEVLFGGIVKFENTARAEANLAEYANYLIDYFTGDERFFERVPLIDYSFKLENYYTGKVSGKSTQRCARVHPIISAMISVLKALIADRVHEGERAHKEQASVRNMLEPLVVWVKDVLIEALRDPDKKRHIHLWGWLDDHLYNIPQTGHLSDDQMKLICRLSCDVVSSLSEIEATNYLSIALQESGQTPTV